MPATSRAGSWRGALTASVLAWTLGFSDASAVILPRQAQTTPGLQPWVTIDANGNAATITPTLVQNNGAPSAVSTFPGQLTAAPTANAANGAGSFLTCSNRNGQFAPFCTPQDRSRLEVGKAYYSTFAHRAARNPVWEI